MALCLMATGYDDDIDIGYGSFLRLRCYIAHSYSKKCGTLYEYITENFNEELSDYIEQRWNKESNKNLDILLWHSDCGGEINFEDCEKLLTELKKLDFKCKEKALIKIYEELLKMLDHCVENKVSLEFI